jgi:hypothetical protein
MPGAINSNENSATNHLATVEWAGEAIEILRTTLTLVV